jgi:hypothetical protein
MNTFVAIERIDELCGDRVNFYSVRLKGKNSNEFFDFLSRMEDVEEVETDLNHLILWLDRIANETGAPIRYFRAEGYLADASALPPPRQIMKLDELEVENIRLYCLRANDNVVFLFNGGIKTKGINNAKNCPNVGPHFIQANKIARHINGLFLEKTITWNEDQTDIIF